METVKSIGVKWLKEFLNVFWATVERFCFVLKIGSCYVAQAGLSKDSCFSLSNAGITGMHNHAQLQ